MKKPPYFYMLLMFFPHYCICDFSAKTISKIIKKSETASDAYSFSAIIQSYFHFSLEMFWINIKHVSGDY